MARRYYRLRRGNGRFLASAVLVGAVLAAVSAHGAKRTGGATAEAGAGSAPQASVSAVVATGQRMAATYGWTGSEWSCLNALWTRESGWNPYAANPTSDARGIPQDINGWNDYAPGNVRAQIAWGLAYIRGRYGDPCAAWNHETAWNWY